MKLYNHPQNSYYDDGLQDQQLSFSSSTSDVGDHGVERRRRRRSHRRRKGFLSSHQIVTMNDDDTKVHHHSDKYDEWSDDHYTLCTIWSDIPKQQENAPTTTTAKTKITTDDSTSTSGSSSSSSSSSSGIHPNAIHVLYPNRSTIIYQVEDSHSQDTNDPMEGRPRIQPINTWNDDDDNEDGFLLLELFVSMMGTLPPGDDRPCKILSYNASNNQCRVLYFVTLQDLIDHTVNRNNDDGDRDDDMWMRFWNATNSKTKDEDSTDLDRRRYVVDVSGIPMNAIQYRNKPFTSDMYAPEAFRHWIGIPKDIMPPLWTDESIYR